MQKFEATTWVYYFTKARDMSRINYNMAGRFQSLTTIYSEVLENITTLYGRLLSLVLFFQKFSVPVGNINRVEERHPLSISRQAEGLLHKRRPFWPEWFSGKGHPGLLWGTTPLFPVTLLARTDYVFPDGCAALRSGNYVV
jgi:hypothetical protein